MRRLLAVSTAALCSCSASEDLPKPSEPCGSFTIVDAEQLAEIEHCREIDELTVTGVPHVALPNLEIVANVYIDATEVELPALRAATYVYITTTAPISLPELDTTNHMTLWSEGALDLLKLTGAMSMNLSAEALTAPALVSVSEGLTVRTAAPTLTLERLRSVGGVLTLSGEEVAALELPLVEELGGLELSALGVTTVDLDAVMHGPLRVDGCSALATVTLPGFTVAEDIRVVASPALEALELPGLTSAARVTLEQNAALTSIGAASLERADAIVVTGNPALEVLALPSLVEVFEEGPADEGLPRGVTLAGNGGLLTVDLSSLERTQSFGVSSSPLLSTLDVSSLVDAGSTVGTLYSDGFWISGTGLSALALPSLTTARSVSVNASPALEALSAPLLETSSVNSMNTPALAVLDLGSLREGEVWLDASTVSEVSLPVFEAGLLWLDIGATLVMVFAPAYREGQVHVTEAPPTLSLPSFESTPRVEITGSPRLQTLSLPALTTASELRVEGCPTLASLSLQSLEGVDSLHVGYTALATVELPALATWGAPTDFAAMSFIGNALLTSLNLPSFDVLSTNCWFSVADNPLLPSCEVTSILGTLADQGVTCMGSVEDTVDEPCN